uniref:pH-response transcription factor pacC/RIM101 n=1 Tax=Ganoderma boninense TaxID=34458 RepID=A0A5K1JZX0_9APHY|nr:pH-response transcription factor pacC/RIM101 [Ganoderma boninense]
MDPRLWENGQRLNEYECDPADGNVCKLTEAAERAQDAKWKRLMANRPPKDALPRNLMPRPGQREPPLYHYGFPFTTQYAIDYARRHHLTIKIVEEDRPFFGNRAVLDFADLDDEWLKSAAEDENDDLESFAISVSRMLMLKHLGERCDFVLDMGRPFSDDWDRIVSLWSNHNFDERFERCFDPVNVVEVLKVAMNETEGRTTVKPQWWFDWDNDVGVYTSVA